MISEELFSRDGVSANSAQLTQLKALFPNCFDVSGQFLLEKFQSEIAEQADISREFYEMNWLVNPMPNCCVIFRLKLYFAKTKTTTLNLKMPTAKIC